MHQSFTIDTAASPDQLFSVLSDLSLYPRWLELVDDASLVTGQSSPKATQSLAWDVTLKAKLGPFARSKKLRMERTVSEANRHIRFERAENDNREHSTWTMNAFITSLPSANGSSAEIRLDYSGELWSKALEAVLMSHVGDAGPKLRALAETG